MTEKKESKNFNKSKITLGTKNKNPTKFRNKNNKLKIFQLNSKIFTYTNFK